MYITNRAVNWSHKCYVLETEFVRPMSAHWIEYFSIFHLDLRVSRRNFVN